ncbi:hypothetical protein KSS87_009270 [Heliosperma pusillum]|nr:hypothetical protein KSS87_023351 [Heliosperma pusillum]KAH9625590.1 hypothetical protein KSS87_009270 [Heliosperma pusillum]
MTNSGTTSFGNYRDVERLNHFRRGVLTPTSAGSSPYSWLTAISRISREERLKRDGGSVPVSLFSETTRSFRYRILPTPFGIVPVNELY